MERSESGINLEVEVRSCCESCLSADSDLFAFVHHTPLRHQDASEVCVPGIQRGHHLRISAVRHSGMLNHNRVPIAIIPLLHAVNNPIRHRVDRCSEGGEDIDPRMTTTLIT